MRFRGSRSRPGRTVVLALLGLFAGCAALGAYADWQWWMPYQGIAITLGATGLFVVALLLGTAPRARTVALALAVAGGGLLAGQNLGPSRPELRQGEGTLRVTLTSPREAAGEHVATCASHAASGELQVSGDPNLRIEILPNRSGTPADVDEREALGFSVLVGDRWEQGPQPRPDDISVSIHVTSVYADTAETMLVSGPDSRLELAWTEAGGTLAFSGLHAREPTPDSALLEQVAGVAEWTCG